MISYVRVILHQYLNISRDMEYRQYSKHPSEKKLMDLLFAEVTSFITMITKFIRLYFLL